MKALLIQLFNRFPITRKLLKEYPIKILATPVSLVFIGFFTMLRPFIHIKIGSIITERIGHLALNVDTFVRRKKQNPSDRAVYILLAYDPCNRPLLEMWRKHIRIIESFVLRSLFLEVENLWRKTPFYEPLEMMANEYELYQETNPVLEFTDEQERDGRAGLVSMGIDPDKDWFVCVFARSSKYLEEAYPNIDWSYHNFRDADINNFIPAIQAIIDRGGYVLRVGSAEKEELSFKHPKFIEYSVHHRTEFLDIYLMAKCRFVLGTTSGICDVAMIFDVPRVGVNWAHMGNAPHGKKNIYIPKWIIDSASQKPYSYKTYFQRVVEDRRLSSNIHHIHQSGFNFKENSPEEIVEVTKEMMDRLEKGWEVPAKEDEKLMDVYFDSLPAEHWSSSVRTPIGLAFLKRNIAFFS